MATGRGKTLPRRGVAAAVQVSILGPVEACVGGGPAPLRRGRQQLLLAVLALHPRLVVPLPHLVDALWPGALPVDPENALHQLVSQLRRAIKPASGTVCTAPGGYRLQVADEDVDARCFEQDLAEARQALGAGRHDVATARAERALGRWRGPAIGGVADGPLGGHAAALERQRIVAELVLADAALALGRPGAALDRLGPVVAEHPHDEELWARYLTALAGSGRPAEALQRYDELGHRLDADLGTTPGAKLRELRTRLLSHDAPGAPAAASPTGAASSLSSRSAGDAAGHGPPGASTATAADTTGAGASAAGPPVAGPVVAGRRRRSAPLARPRTSFVGRERERSALRASLLGGPRLTTVVGPAGCGKTRLAIEVAGDLEPERDGVTLVRLDTVSHDSGVTAALSAAAGLTEDGGRLMLEFLAEHLEGQLLVLDNVEHVREGAGRLCEALLDLQPDLLVLATGRQRLGIPGEHVLRLAPLAEDPAVELLLDRAAAVRGSRDFAAADLPAAARLVHALDGLPLAIELVSAQAAALTLPQLAATLGERLGLLEGEPPTGPARHARLADAIDWSVDLLGPAPRQLFTACGVFAGAFDVDAAARVRGISAEQALPLLVALVERSLLEPASGSPERPAFRTLETLRAHARRRLRQEGQLEERQSRLLDHLVGLAEAGDAGLRGPDQAEWLARFDVAAADLAAGLGLALDQGRTDEALRLVTACCRYWDWRGRLHEADRATAAVLADGRTAGSAGRASVLAWRAWFDVELGNWSAATSAAEEALRTARGQGDIDTELLSLATAASVARLGGQPRDAVALADDAEQLALEHGLDWSAARAAVSRGHARLGLGDLVGAQADAADGAARFTATGDARGVAWAAALDALCAASGAAPERAGETAAAALELAEALEDQRTCLLLLEILALDARQRGRADLAQSFRDESTRRRHDRGQARHPLDEAGPA